VSGFKLNVIQLIGGDSFFNLRSMSGFTIYSLILISECQYVGLRDSIAGPTTGWQARHSNT
jgi:hypothetical protein